MTEKEKIYLLGHLTDIIQYVREDSLSEVADEIHTIIDYINNEVKITEP